MDTAPAQSAAPTGDPVATLQADNDGYLAQVAELVAATPAPAYRRRSATEDAIGAHIRHLLEHYESLLRDVDMAVDYARRERDPEVETQPQAATRRIAEVRRRLAALPARYADHTLPVVHHQEAADGATTAVELRSSLARELQFLLSHTVHHLALIAILARHQGLEVPPDFGVAPSTLRHRRASAVAAR